MLFAAMENDIGATDAGFLFDNTRRIYPDGVVEKNLDGDRGAVEVVYPVKGPNGEAWSIGGYSPSGEFIIVKTQQGLFGIDVVRSDGKETDINAIDWQAVERKTDKVFQYYRENGPTADGLGLDANGTFNMELRLSQDGGNYLTARAVRLKLDMNNQIPGLVEAMERASVVGKSKKVDQI